MTLRLFLLFMCLVLCCSRASFGQGVPCQYQLAAVIAGPPCGVGGPITVATALNNVGTVVGYYHCTAGAPRPFKWTEAGGFQFIPLPPWLGEASPADVNDHDIMVGTGVGPVAGQRGFMCDLNTGIWTGLLPQNPPIGWSGATGINSSNVVSGWRSIGSKGDPTSPCTAFVWNQEGFNDLGTLNGFSAFAVDIADDGTVAGEMGSVNAVAVPCAWDGVNLLEGPTLAGFSTRPLAINDGGIIAGWAAITPGFGVQTRGFVWTESGMMSIGVLPRFNRSYALDIDNMNVVVGVCEVIGSSISAPVIWHDGNLIDLRTKVQSGSLLLRSAEAISETGVICARATLNGDVISVVLLPLYTVGDVDGDCTIDIDDLLFVIGAWGPHEIAPSPADLNSDRVVDILDLLIVIDEWTA